MLNRKCGHVRLVIWLKVTVNKFGLMQIEESIEIVWSNATLASVSKRASKKRSLLVVLGGRYEKRDV